MNAASLPIEGLQLADLLRAAADKDVVFLTANGETKFALVSADEGDEEICALRSNAEFMAYLAECKERGRSQPRTSLEQIRESLGLQRASSPGN